MVARWVGGWVGVCDRPEYQEYFFENLTRLFYIVKRKL